MRLSLRPLYVLSGITQTTWKRLSLTRTLMLYLAIFEAIAHRFFRVLTITLPSNTEEFFYQDVGQEPTLIRGNFFVSGENDLNEEITFTIYDPAGEVF